MASDVESIGASEPAGDEAQVESGWDEIAIDVEEDKRQEEEQKRRLFKRIGLKIGGVLKSLKTSKERDYLISNDVALNDHDEVMEVDGANSDVVPTISADSMDNTETVAGDVGGEDVKTDEYDPEMQKVLRKALDERREYLRRQRKQEILERDLNAHLLTVEYLEEEVLAGNPEVAKRFVEYEGVQIPVYDLKGLPFEMLTTAIDYRKYSWGDPSSIGSQVSKKLVQDPSVWIKRFDEVKEESTFGNQSGEGKSNIICVSYTNSETNISSRLSGLVYGFSHVDAGSVLRVASSDIASAQVSSGHIDINDENAIYDLQRYSNKPYNEINISRYSETGMPKLPDYIVVENGKIDENVLKHAAFFGIPIISIESAPYEKKMWDRLIEMVDEMDFHGEWEDLYSSISEIRQIPNLRKLVFGCGIRIDFDCDDEVGLGNLGEEVLGLFREEGASQGSKDKKEVTISMLKGICALEKRKRVDYIAELLRNEINSCKQMKSNGGRIVARFFMGPAQLHVDQFDASTTRPRGFSISFKAPGGKTIKLKVYDGEHDGRSDSIWRSADQITSCYDELAPLIEEYFETIGES